MIYVEQNTKLGCSGIDGPLEQDYNDGNGCAIATVHGTYTKSMTIGSAADILIDGDLVKSGDPVLGLVAHELRARSSTRRRDCTPLHGDPDRLLHAAEHPRSRPRSSRSRTRSSSTTTTAARGSGTLTVDGAIAQRFRGPVGTFSSSTGSA